MVRRYKPRMPDAELVGYLRQGFGVKMIKKLTGVTLDYDRIRRLREQHGIVRTDMRAIMLEQIPNHSNAIDLAKAMGITRVMTIYYLGPFLKTMRAGGTLHNCACRKLAYHQGGCNSLEGDGEHFVTDELLVSLLKQGFRRETIIAKIGTNVSQKRITRLLTLHEIKDSGVFHPNMKRKTLRNKNKGGQLYARVCLALGHMTDQPLRDDARSEMFLDLSTGKLKTEDIEAKARSYSGAAIAEWQSRYGPRSLDEVRFDDGDATLLDSLEDESALAAFDDLFEPEEDGLDCWN